MLKESTTVQGNETHSPEMESEFLKSTAPFVFCFMNLFIHSRIVLLPSSLISKIILNNL